MRKSKVMAILMAAMVATSLFTGCSTNKGEAEETEATKSATATEKPKDFSGVKLKVSAYRNLQTDSNNLQYGLGAEEFKKKYPGSEVEFLVQGATGNNEQIVAAVASGQPQDLHLTIGPAIPAAFQADLYEPVDNYVNINDPVFSKVTVDSTLYKGKHYGVSSVWMNDIYTVTYNETQFKELGVKTPIEYYKEGKWNWDSWYKMVDDLKKANAPAGAMNYDNNPSVFNRYSQKWNADSTAVDNFSSKENTEWIDFYRKNFIDYGVTRGYHGDLANKANGFVYYLIPSIMNETESLRKGSKDVVRYIPLPEKDGSTSAYMVDYHFSILKGSKNPEAAMELAKYMIKSRNDEMQKLYQTNMVPEDYELMKKSVENGYIVHGVPGQPSMGWKAQYEAEFKAGKTMSTFISENADKFKAAADAWNKQVK
jgi:ABC-type glycerol-3-phosphate transport system substrate-binding protein